MKFTGQARLDGIAQVVAAVKKIPVIGNGDVKLPTDAKRMFEATGCAGIMIGRGALIRPWIFRDTWAFLTTGSVPAEPTIEEKCGMIRRHFYNLVRFRNERVAVLEFRKRISWYAKTMNPCRCLRDPMREIDSPADFERVLQQFLEWRLSYDEAVRAGRIQPESEELVDAA
jgi:tRNA-dihydrouridine synthase